MFLRPITLMMILSLFASCYVSQKQDMNRILSKNSLFLASTDATIKRLDKKNDSLNQSGSLFDSVSLRLRKEIKSRQRQNDSLKAEVGYFQKRLYFRRGYWEEFTFIKKSIIKIDETISSGQQNNDSILNAIEKKMDEGDLSAEKRQMKQILNDATSQQEKETVRVDGLEETKKNMSAGKNLADVTAAEIDERFNRFKRKMDSLMNEIKTVGKKIETPKDFLKDYTIIKTKVRLIDSVVNKSALSREFVFQMIEEGMLRAKPNLFNLAAFFGPGGYIIPADKRQIAKQYFTPIVDSIVVFSNKYETIMRTSTVIVHGYADATSIGAGSSLYGKVAAYLKEEYPEKYKNGIGKPIKEELNAGLSAMRAEEISRLLNTILMSKYPDFKSINKITFEFTEVGNGEKLPDPRISDYKKNDERRRIVIIFWSVLPDE